MGIGPLLGARVAMGIGEASCLPSLQTIAAKNVPKQLRSRFWGLLTASLSVGTIGAYSISGPLIDAYGWPTVFFVAGGAGGALAVRGAAAAPPPSALSLAYVCAAPPVAGSMGTGGRK
jgi:MFS family permease